MPKERFADEFKSEAARPPVERDYTFVVVAKRLGTAAQSIYKRMRASSPANQLSYLWCDMRT